MDAPPIQYARTDDGVNIAYWTLGDGPPVIELHFAAVSNIDHEWQIPALRTWYERLAQNFRVIRLDFRGGGLSERTALNVGMDGWMRDLDAVVVATASEPTALLGISAGGQVALSYAAAHPQKVARVATFATIVNSLSGATSAIWDSARNLAKFSHTMWADMLANAVFRLDGDEQTQISQLVLSAVSPEMQPHLSQAWQAVNISDALGSVSVPVLVLDRHANKLDPEDARQITAAIRDARLHTFNRKTCLPFFEDPEAVHQVLEGFLREDPSSVGTRPHRTEAGMAWTVDVTDPHPAQLTPREVEVLRLAAMGRTNPQIADHLVISPGTVTRHVSNILNKTRLHNRTELARYAIARGLLD